VPELLHHQHTFFGCLTIRRIARPRQDDRAWGAEFERLAAKLWHRLAAGDAHTDDVLLATRAFDLGLAERCPVLDQEQRCSLHTDRKPAICKVVPFDALAPDAAQHRVLSERAAEARSFGSDCIVPGEKPGFDVVTRRLTVVDGGARQALAERRRDLAEERVAWGDRVFQLLEPDLFSSTSRLERVPSAGFMTLSLAPVLIALLEQSKLSRARCVAYLDAQALVAERLLYAATEAGHGESDRARQLAAFTRTNARLRLQLKDD